MTKFKFVMTMALCLLAGAADAAVAVGSCEKKPATMRIGGSASISLVNEYDPESREYYDMGVYYIQVSLSKGEAYTVWLDGGIFMIDVDFADERVFVSIPDGLLEL